ncbi:glyceraldehyde 3-phosphate dehydrogenase NAD-binding domain-containing protein [Paraflavitalea sp. CAU 1676]|uniref:type I glyceraldehyde-3-phosphate dehydrogenase n=1 Tax=Paraflavitalea sp. CAU 1676 TaxID=3032598 RepID=UPI0023DB272D|nr:glyceraldehyde 3-phosphate dehydrogenase NAD-binding domain-containing protein [Paraflavitalea sp. CAU 1676]MDF2190196.1 glyceraldehyde 3-phosphate dehydrogenase NAD-binding domain-containing protein [Paraflavitalea sp. CAU 1676]
MRIAINGMGRIGRLLFRRLAGRKDLELIAINDIMEPGNLAYLLKYDSVYGTYQHEITLENDERLLVNGQSIAVLQQSDPAKLPWKDLGVDVVLECSGKFTSRAGASTHLSVGAKKVLLSTTGAPEIPLMIYGFNQHLLTPETDIISPGGCMTNCSTHILYLMNSIGIESAHINVLHSYTSRQGIVDAPHKQFRRGRAAAESIIPVEIDLAHSLETLFPLLQGKIATVSTRVPVANGALADFTLQLKQPAAADQINQLFRTAAATEYKGIIDYTEEQLVSLDIKGNTHSCILDGTLTSVVGNHVKLITWFDNEFGYTSRMLDWLQYWKRVLG